MNAVVHAINSAGQAFVDFALPMLIQSGVFVLILLLVDLVLRRRVRAVFRYWIWMLVLLKLVLPPSLCSPLSFGTWFGQTLEAPTAALYEAATPPEQKPQDLWQPQAPLGDGLVPSAPIAKGFALDAATPVVTPPAPTPQTEYNATRTTATPAPAEPITSVSWQALVLLAWAATALALLLLLLQRAWFVRGLVAQAQEAPPKLLAALDECRGRVGLARPIALRVSPNATSPAVCGLLHPVILIPKNLTPKLPPRDLQAVLLHELAHVKRGDLWVNLIQTLLQIAYFYNPLLWLANLMIRRVREQAVDEAVLVAMGETARDYPEMLINVAKLAFRKRPALSLRLIGVVESKSALSGRIKHILGRPLPKTAKLGLLGLVAVFLVAAVLLPMAKARPMTDRARNVMTLAREEARQFNHRYVGTEHILLALAREKDAVSTQVLENLGVDIDTLRAEVGKLLKPDAEPVTRRRLPRTPRAKRVMKYAREEARALSHDYIGTEHILLGLTEETNSIAAQVLANLNLTPTQIRAEAFKLIRAGGDSDVSDSHTGTDADGDGLSDFQEAHKYLTDPTTRDSDGDGTPDGDWTERREYTYSVRSVFRFLPPLDEAALNDAFQDARVLRQTSDYVEIEVIHYPLATVDESIDENRSWRQDYAHLTEYLAPGATTNWDEPMRRALLAELKADGIDVDTLSDKQTVERVARWLLKKSRYLGKVFTTFYVHCPNGKPEVFPGLEDAYRHEFERDQDNYDWTLDEHFDHEVLGKGMFYNKTHGSCTSTAVYLTTVLRALGIPTRMVLVSPAVDASDREQILMAKKGITHHRVRETILAGLRKSSHGFTNHTLNEVYVGNRWVRLDSSALGPSIFGVHHFGLQTHLYTIDDLFGVHSNIANPPFTAQDLGTSPKPDIFIFSPGKVNVWEEMLEIVRETTFNKTGRPHRREFYDNVFEGVWQTKPGDIVVLLFALDAEERVPEGYEDLLPERWPQIESRLRQGQAVELAGEARDMRILLLATPRAAELESLIQTSALLAALGASEDVKAARATEERPRWLVEFANGVKVQLLGVCTHPSAGQPWWGLDGTPLETAPYETTGSRLEHKEGYVPYEYAAQVLGARDVSIRWKVPGSTYSSGTGRAISSDGRRLAHTYAYTANQPLESKTANVFLGIASGDWETRAVHKTLDREGSYTLKNDYAVAFGAAYEKNDDAHVPVTTNIQSTVLNRRLVAIDIEGKSHRGGSYSAGGNVLHSSTYAFDVPLSRITEFRFETRPYTWVEFRNVSLRPGQDAGLQVHFAATYDPHVAGEGVEVTLPEWDQGILMFDLASGKLVQPPYQPPGTMSEFLQAIKESGEGDLLYDCDQGDRQLILIRDATSEQAEQIPGELPSYLIGPDPEVLTITTAEGRCYEITILAADDESCRLKYAPLPDDEGAGGGALVATPGVAAKLPNGVTVEFLAYSFLSPAHGLIWFDPQGEETTIPGVYEADVEGLGTVLAFRVEPPEAYLSAEMFRGPDAQNIKNPWQLPERNLWLLPLDEERRFANLRLFTRLTLPPVIETITLTEENVGQLVEVNRCGIAGIVDLHVGDTGGAEMMVEQMGLPAILGADTETVEAMDLQDVAEAPVLQFSTVNAPDSYQSLVALLDKDGRTYPVQRIKHTSSGAIYQGRLWPSRLAGLMVEASAVHTADVRLRNISLTPQHVTEIQIEPAPDRQISWKRSYASMLREILTNSITAYRKDHGGRFPPGLEALERNHDEEAFRWLLTHIVYVGKGKSFDDDPPSMIAFDKTLLAEGRGTYVFYSDGRLEFESPLELEELGLLWSPYVHYSDGQFEFESPLGLQEPVEEDESDATAQVSTSLSDAKASVTAIHTMLGQWVADARAGRFDATKRAYGLDASRAQSDIEDMQELLSINPDWEFSLLSVAWNDEAALAVSGKLGAGDPKAEPEPVVIVWNLSKLDQRWVITDIDLEQIEGLQRENARFLRNHPGARVWYVEPGAVPSEILGRAVEPDTAGEARFVVQGKVTDVSGEPMEEVWVNVDCGFERPQRAGRTQTNAQGRYALDFKSAWVVTDADPYGVGIQPALVYAQRDGFYETSLGHKGNLALAGQRPGPDEQRFVAGRAGVVLVNEPYELDFVMAPAARIEGQILDEAGTPVPRPEIWLHHDKTLSKRPTEGVTRGNGWFTFEGIPRGSIWLTGVRERLMRSETVTLPRPGTYRITLQYAQSPSGQPNWRIVAFERPAYDRSDPAFDQPRVVDPNGVPVAGAQVALCTKDNGVTISGGKLVVNRMGGGSSTIVETDDQGRFSFADELEAFHIVAAHEKGFAWVTNEEFTALPEIRLQNWGRIDGAIYIGRQRGTNRRLGLMNYINKNAIDQRIRYDYESYSDPNGRFIFDKVPPGWAEIGYMIQVGGPSLPTSTYTARTPVQILPGQITRIAVGGQGRPVVGKFVPPTDYDGPVYFGAGLRALDTARPERPTPDNYEQMSNREQQQWLNQWLKTDEAQAHYDTMWHDPQRRHYSFRIQDDGTFRIEDVIPGKYKFTVWLEERFTGQGRQEEIGAYYGTVEVPEMADAYRDEPLDLGELVVQMRAPLHVGDTAPLFEAETLDGNDVRLADYRGRFVLLSFWHPASRPELDRLKELHKTYRDSGKLQIIGLGGSDRLDEVKKFVTENKIDWPQIYFGQQWDQGIAKQYGLGGLPYILLIDPEGKIVATWLRGEKLTSTVREALENAPRGISGRVLDPNGPIISRKNLYTVARSAGYKVGPEWFQVAESSADRVYRMVQIYAERYGEPGFNRVLDDWVRWKYKLDRVVETNSATTLFTQFCNQFDEERKFDARSDPRIRAIGLISDKLDAEALMDRYIDALRSRRSFCSSVGYRDALLSIEDPVVTGHEGECLPASISAVWYALRRADEKLDDRYPSSSNMIENKLTPILIEQYKKRKMLDLLDRAVLLGGTKVAEFLLKQNWQGVHDERDREIVGHSVYVNKWLLRLINLDDPAGETFRREHPELVLWFADLWAGHPRSSMEFKSPRFLLLDKGGDRDSLAWRYWPRYSQKMDATGYEGKRLDRKFSYLMMLEPYATTQIYFDSWIQVIDEREDVVWYPRDIIMGSVPVLRRRPLATMMLGAIEERQEKIGTRNDQNRDAWDRLNSDRTMLTMLLSEMTASDEEIQNELGSPADSNGVSAADESVASHTAERTDADPTWLDLREDVAPPPDEILGRVVDPNGAPVPGAQVALCMDDRSVKLRAGTLIPGGRDGWAAEVVKTDADGRFAFAEEADEFLIVAAHETGFAQITSEAFISQPSIRLQPWGRVEGTLRIGPRPAADEVVNISAVLSGQMVGRFRYSKDATSESDGRFVFEKVPSGILSVGRMQQVSRSRSVAISRQVLVSPGETLNIQLGGTGRPVVGRLILPEKHDGPGQYLYMLVPVDPSPPWPANWSQMSGSERSQWRRQRNQTPQGQAHREAIVRDANRRSYTFAIDREGGFRIEDVVPRAYNVEVWFHDESGSDGIPRPIGPYSAAIEVPAMSQAYTDEPLDLGELALDLPKP
jgi:beta-lactamase regulating signal transducer with metallopeptidase domain/peroxiredoxin/protocatechuate 3,4-dioxygenase beta subunit